MSERRDKSDSEADALISCIYFEEVLGITEREVDIVPRYAGGYTLELLMHQ